MTNSQPIHFYASAFKVLRDPLVFGLNAVILVAVTLLASFIPARRAARVDPMEALRYE